MFDPQLAQVYWPACSRQACAWLYAVFRLPRINFHFHCAGTELPVPNHVSTPALGFTRNFSFPGLHPGLFKVWPFQGHTNLAGPWLAQVYWLVPECMQSSDCWACWILCHRCTDISLSGEKFKKLCAAMCLCFFYVVKKTRRLSFSTALVSCWFFQTMISDQRWGSYAIFHSPGCGSTSSPTYPGLFKV